MKFSFRSRRKRQRGFGIAETMLGLFLGFTAAVGGSQFVTHSLAAATTSTVIQDRTSMVSEALDRTSQNIQVADPILYAGPDQLMTKSVDGSNLPVMTRFVKSGNTYYQQSWTGYTGSYMPDPGLWIPVTSLSGPAPNGDGNQTTTALVTEVANGISYTAPTESPAAHVFGYVDSAGNAIDTSVAPLTTTAANTVNIKLVNITLASTTVDPSFYQNSTSAVPRNTPAGVSDGAVAAPSCPVVTFDATSTAGKPVLDWTTVKGAASYDIYRNAAVAANIPVPDTQATGTWTDTTNPAGVADSTTYKVVAKTSAGVASVSCRPAVWRPQIGLPVLSNTTVQPAGTDASAWTGSPLTTPRVVFNWAPVAGTSGYELIYREVDPATGNPLGSGAFTNIQFAPAVTTFTWDNGGWGRRYEWYLKADARSGQSSESRHIQVLTHPSAPANVTVKASYKDNTNGTNDLTWTAISTATNYDIWRYNAGTSGAATLVGSTTGLSYSDTVPYGTQYTYYIAARNTGPRGTDASGNDVTGDRSSPSPESAAAAANKAAPITQLQYPPIPTVAAMGAAATNTRDYDGSNRIIWNPTVSATGYQVKRFSISGAAVTCLTGADCSKNTGGTTATQLDNAVAPGSQYDYGVIAYNATGLSKDISAKARLTQRPPAQALTINRAPSLTDDTASFTGVQNADTGNSGADLFCTNTTCSYEIQRNGAGYFTSGHTQSGGALNYPNQSNPPGATIDYRVRAHNPAITNGGWSDTLPAVVNTYPGTFATGQSLGDANGNSQSRFRVNLVNDDVNGSSTNIQNGYTTLWYGDSAGATWFDFSRSVDSSHEGESGDPNVGLPDRNWYYGSYGGGTANHWTVIASPGTIYHHTVIAHAANGLQRVVITGGYWTPPDVPYTGTTIVTCSGNQYTNQTSATWNYPNHHIGARLIALNHGVLYGDYSGTSVIGMAWYQGQGPTDTSWTYLNWYDGNPDINSGPGQGYYYGVTNGFRIWNNISGGPNSTTVRQTMSTYATFNNGCGPYGGYWWDLWEPTYACYGYVPGQPCMANNPWNRPQWHSF